MIDPIYILSLGAGVQSSTLALMAAWQEVKPLPHAAVFADTHDEPRAVYEYLNWLERELPYKVVRVSQGSLSEAALSILVNKKTGKPYYSNRIPAFVKSAGKASAGKVQRHCTRDFKIYPIQRATRSMIPRERMLAWRRHFKSELKAWTTHEKEKKAARREKRPCRSTWPHEAWERMQAAPLVIQWIGISKDEIVRAKPSRVPYVRHDWPLIEAGMRRADCLAWMQERGYPKPPRSACIYCPYKSNDEWRLLRDQSPEEFAEAAQFERDLQKTHTGIETPGKLKGIPFLHRSLVPLEQVDLTESVPEPDLFGSFGNECEGMCGL